MHIEVKTQLQKLGTNLNRKLAPEMIDWYLNVAQQQLVDNSVEPRIDGTPRFQIHRGRKENIQSLIVSHKLLDAYYNSEDNRYFAALPANCNYLLEDGSHVKQLCQGAVNTVNYSVINVTRVAFPLSPGSAGQFYRTIHLTINGVSHFKLDELQAVEQTGYLFSSSREEHFYFRDYILDKLHTQDIYWEKFQDLYYPNHFLFVTKSSQPPTIILEVDGANYVGQNQTKTLEIHDTTTRHIVSPNSMVSNDSTMVRNATPYFNTAYMSPLSELGGNVVHVYANKNFIVCKVAVTFIRKPARINLTLGQNSELSWTVHQKICDMAVERAQNRVGDPAWKETTEQNVITKNS